MAVLFNKGSRLSRVQQSGGEECVVRISEDSLPSCVEGVERCRVEWSRVEMGVAIRRERERERDE